MSEELDNKSDTQAEISEELINSRESSNEDRIDGTETECLGLTKSSYESIYETFGHNLSESILSELGFKTDRNAEEDDAEEETSADESETDSSGDSFDRFNSQMSRLLLSYLSVYDKIAYRAVCLRWKRTLLRGQHRLIISQSRDSIDSIRRSELSRVLKLCRFVRHICIVYREIGEEVLETISDNCRRLEKFACQSYFANGVSAAVLNKFAAKCGPRLTSIQLNSVNNVQLKTLLRSTPNARAVLCNNDISVFVDSDPNFLPELEELKVSEFTIDDLRQFTTKYGQQIKTLTIHFSSSNLLGVKMNDALCLLSRLENLERINIYMNLISRTAAPINEGLATVSRECAKLENLVIRMKGKFLVGKVLPAFANFHGLRKCLISVPYDHTALDYGNIEALKNCVNLSQLTLILPKLSDYHLVDINEFLPNLSVIRIHTESPISNKGLRYLANLSRLSELEIIIYGKINDSYITDTGIQNVLHSCPHLRTLSLDSNSRVTKATFESLVQLAASHPQNQYKFLYKIGIKAAFDYNNTVGSDLPVNLFVEIYSTLDTIDQL